ncbi:MAG TPA: prolyl oligopeptidase family serine peptidase, partial [Rhizomicrobium sp.]|nr:prolyl oligopeptidase family serine peptidase [Rhizomicrobium sp.]
MTSVSITRELVMRALAPLAAAVFLATAAQAAPERVVHRFMSVAISPDGKNVASVEGDSSPFGGEPVIRSLVIRSVDGKHTATVALPCGAVRECWPSSPAWSADAKTLTFALRKPGTHARSVYSVAADGSGLTDILDFNGTIGELKYGPGGKLAVLAVEGATKEVGATQAGTPITGDLSGPVPEQRIGILEGGKLAWQSPADLFVYQYDWIPDSSGFVGTAAHGDGDNNWWVAKLYRFNDGAAKVIFDPPDAKHQIADPVVSPDGKTVAFISGIMSDFGSTGGDVYIVRIDDGASLDVTPDTRGSARTLGWDCGDSLRVQMLFGGKTSIARVWQGGIHPLAGRYGKVLAETEATLHGENGGVSAICSAPVTATVSESFTSPPEIEVGSIGGWHDLTHANAGLTMPLKAKSITWQSDSYDVQGWLLLPQNAKGKSPLITIVHGGPAAASIPSFYGPSLNKKLLERGYALFLPNPRGSYGQGEAFTAANVRDLGHGDLRDILAGIDAVEKMAPIDDNRLGITGGSYGGFMTMWAVTQTNRFKAGVAAAGLSNWLSYYGENGIDEWMIPYFGKTVYDDPEVYARSSPITFIKNVKT